MSETRSKPDWMSIKDAAAYLDVGEPTIYRWMRDGKITFRKVGDSTRFLQEDLDALVQVYPSARDAERVQEYCPVCHHNELVPGTFQAATGSCYFRPAKTRFWTLQEAAVPLAARMCTRCGAIVSFGDIGKLESLREKARAKNDEAGS